MNKCQNSKIPYMRLIEGLSRIPPVEQVNESISEPNRRVWPGPILNISHTSPEDVLSFTSKLFL